MKARIDATLWLNEDSTAVDVKISRVARNEIELAVVLPDYADQTPSTAISLTDVDAAALVGALSVILSG